MQTEEFSNIVQDILENNKFKELDNVLHHGVTRQGHCLRVAKATYTCAKILKLDVNTATRAALLHDFFENEDYKKSKNSFEKLSEHPELAIKNAKKHFALDEKGENIIASHMFPLGNTMPKYAESWLVSTIDKTVGAYEMYRFKFSLVINIWAIFLFNMITIQK